MKKLLILFVLIFCANQEIRTQKEWRVEIVNDSIIKCCNHYEDKYYWLALVTHKDSTVTYYKVDPERQEEALKALALQGAYASLSNVAREYYRENIKYATLITFFEDTTKGVK